MHKRSRIRLRKKPGKKELVERIISLARLPRDKKTVSLFSRTQLIELESYLRRADMLLCKFAGGDNAEYTN